MRAQDANRLSWIKMVLIALTLFGAIQAEKTSFAINAAQPLNVVSARLCQTLTQGLGIPVERTGARLQSLNQQPAFQLEFDDGGWMLKQYFLLVPIIFAIGWVYKCALWKMVLVGIATTTLYICIRSMLLGASAAMWGAPFATGTLDTVLRYGQTVFCMLALMTFATRSNKTAEEEAD